LAQFGRSGIVEDLVTKMTERFAANLEAKLSGVEPSGDQSALKVGSLFWSLLRSRLMKLLGRARS
jgi:hypothetical protein